jgi:hypothetical protein
MCYVTLQRPYRGMGANRPGHHRQLAEQVVESFRVHVQGTRFLIWHSHSVSCLCPLLRFITFFWLTIDYALFPLPPLCFHSLLSVSTPSSLFLLPPLGFHSLLSVSTPSSMFPLPPLCFHSFSISTPSSLFLLPPLCFHSLLSVSTPSSLFPLPQLSFHSAAVHCTALSHFYSTWLDINRLLSFHSFPPLSLRLSLRSIPFTPSARTNVHTLVLTHSLPGDDMNSNSKAEAVESNTSNNPHPPPPPPPPRSSFLSTSHCPALRENEKT